MGDGAVVGAGVAMSGQVGGSSAGVAHGVGQERTGGVLLGVGAGEPGACPEALAGVGDDGAERSLGGRQVGRERHNGADEQNHQTCGACPGAAQKGAEPARAARSRCGCGGAGGGQPDEQAPEQWAQAGEHDSEPPPGSEVGGGDGRSGRCWWWSRRRAPQDATAGIPRLCVIRCLSELGTPRGGTRPGHHFPKPGQPQPGEPTPSLSISFTSPNAQPESRTTRGLLHGHRSDHHPSPGGPPSHTSRQTRRGRRGPCGVRRQRDWGWLAPTRERGCSLLDGWRRSGREVDRGHRRRLRRPVDGSSPRR
jgi:hypothetical protein